MISVLPYNNLDYILEPTVSNCKGTPITVYCTDDEKDFSLRGTCITKAFSTNMNVYNVLSW